MVEMEAFGDPEEIREEEEGESKEKAPVRLTLEQIASFAWLTQRAYCLQILGHDSAGPFDELSETIKDKILQKTDEIMKNASNPNYREIARAHHDRELTERLQDGWKYGPEQILEEKTHPWILPYSALPEEIRVGDFLFASTVKMLLPIWNGK